METPIILIEPLLKRVEEYGKTSFELLKLKSLDKTAEVSSVVISRLFLGIVLLIFVITLNIAAALWIGEMMGKNYYGFLIVASFYGLIATVLMLFHTGIKTRINNSIIIELLN